jgi:hypothetical protein
MLAATDRPIDRPDYLEPRSNPTLAPYCYKTSGDMTEHEGLTIKPGDRLFLKGE